MLCWLLFLFLLQIFHLLCSFMFFLELLLQHMQLLLCSILCLRMIFISRCHLVVQVSKLSFIVTGSSWACNFVSPLCCQQPSSRIHCIQYDAFIWCSWCCSMWWCCHHILMSLSTNNLMSSWVGNLIDTWSTLLSWNHCTYTTKRQMNTCDTWRHGNTHGKKSISQKLEWTWELTSKTMQGTIWATGRLTDCWNYAMHSLV